MLSYLIVPHGEGFIPVHVSNARRDEPLFSNGLAAKRGPRFYPGYTGPRRPNLDGIEASGYVSGKNLILSGTVAGPIAPKSATGSEDASYWFGIDRGGASKTGPFPGRGNIRFDATVSATIVKGKLTASLALNNPQTNQPPTSAESLPSKDVKISGNTITITVPLSMLPSTGHAIDQWNVNFFTRNPDQKPNIHSVASFTPEFTEFQIYVKPPSGS